MREKLRLPDRFRKPFVISENKMYNIENITIGKTENLIS